MSLGKSTALHIMMWFTLSCACVCVCAGIFQSEESRVVSGGILAVGDKRRIDGISQAHGATTGSPHDIWSEFQTMMMASGGNRGMDYGIMTAGMRSVDPS